MNTSFYFAKCALAKAFAEYVVADLLFTSLQLGFHSLGRLGKIFLAMICLLFWVFPHFLAPNLNIVRAVTTILFALSKLNRPFHFKWKYLIQNDYGIQTTKVNIGPKFCFNN